MPDSEHSISAAPWTQALDTLRAVTERNEDISLDEDLLARVSVAEFDATDAARGWVADALSG